MSVSRSRIFRFKSRSSSAMLADEEDDATAVLPEATERRDWSRMAPIASASSEPM